MPEDNESPFNEDLPPEELKKAMEQLEKLANAPLPEDSKDPEKRIIANALGQIFAGRSEERKRIDDFIVHKNKEGVISEQDMEKFLRFGKGR